MITNALSVDVEEYYHAMIFQEGTKGFVGRYFVSRIEESVDCVLALLGRRDIRATFFILGEVAVAHPTVIRKIAVQGHEIASHGNRHELVSRLSPEEFRGDVSQAKAILEDLTCQAVIGYRAPNYSIGPEQAWA